MDDYRGAFDPEFHLGRLSRRALAVLAREYQLAGHLQDRAGIPHVLGRWGQEAMREIAIAEWMGASSVYTQRIKRALRFSGDDVGTIFKGIQFDIGAPHGFLDFRFQVHDEKSGEFWLPYCGALMDVEPMGEEFVVGMCHAIEDPTFDATAVATNPRAQVRPIHRPPRVPEDRTPHCHWRVRIEPDAAPVEEIALAGKVRASRLARLEIADDVGAGGSVGAARDAAVDSGGRDDYSGAFDPDLELEDFSARALVRVGQEFCLQGHLLVRAFMTAIAERWDVDAAREIASKQWIGIAGLAAERVALATGIAAFGEGDGGGHVGASGGGAPLGAARRGDATDRDPGDWKGAALDAIAKLFQLHPAFHPRAYVDLHVERSGDRVCCWIGDCDAFAEGDPYSWFALLGGVGAEPHRALDAIAQVIDRRARSAPLAVHGARYAWSIAIDEATPPAREASEVRLAKVSKGATFRFASRRGGASATAPG